MIRRVFHLYRAAFSGLPRDLWLLAFIALVNRSGSMVLPFLGLYLTREQGLGVAAAGRLLALYGVGAVVGAWLGGWLSDRIGALQTQRLSLAASGAGFLLFPALRSPGAIAVGVLVLSVIAESFRPANMAEFSHRAPAGRQGRAFALLRLAANLGVSVGPAVGGILAVRSYVWLFVGDALTCWIAAAMLLLLVRPLPADMPAAGGPLPAPDRGPWRDGPFLALMGLVMLIAVVFFQVMSTLPLDLNGRLGFREDVIGGLLALNAGLIVIFEMVLIHWSERHERMHVVAGGVLLLCLGFGLIPLGISVGYVMLTIVVWTVGEMFALPMITAVVADRAGRGMRGRYMGFYTMAFGLAFLLGPFCGTAIYARFGARALWFGIGGMGPALAIGALLLRRPLARRSAIGAPSRAAAVPGTGDLNDNGPGR